MSGTGRPARTSVVPQAAGRSLWFTAAWTGVGAALVGAIAAVVAVAILWLPAAGSSGRSGSVLRAGLITFTASLHGGVTVDGLDAAFLPLGLLLAAALICRRAGRGLAAAAATLDEVDPARLAAAGIVQAVTFAATAGVFAALSQLGTSAASVPGAVVAGLLLFGVSGGTALARATPLGATISAAVPRWTAPGLRIAAAVAATYLTAGAALAGASLVVHHREVEQLSARVGGGWAGLPILLLGVLAVPNAAIAGAAYLAGPGFAVGSGTAVALRSAPHGRLPAFPVLGALPTGPAPWIVWLLAVLTPLAAGVLAARIAARSGQRWSALGAGVVLFLALAAVLAWQGGGRIGSAHLNAIGASPWQVGLAVAGGAGIAGTVWLALGQAVSALRARGRDVTQDGRLSSLVATISATVEDVLDEVKEDVKDTRKEVKEDKLAG